MTENRDAPPPLSDQEIAFLRYVEYGQLPSRVPPDQRVELIETEPRRNMPEPEPPMDT